MSLVAVGVGGAALVGGVSSYLGSQNAASAETNAANTSAATSQNMFNTEQQTEQPYVQAGNSAVSQLSNNMGSYNQPFTMNEFQNGSPEYGFDLQQGQQAIQQSAAANSGLVNAGTMAALNNYSQSNALNSYNSAFNNYQTQMTNSYNRLAGVAQLGQAAASNTGSAAIQTGQNISQAQTSAGNASAAASIAGSNAVNNTVSGASNGLLLSSLIKSPGTSGSGSASGGSDAATPSYGNYNPDGSGNMGIDYSQLAGQ